MTAGRCSHCGVDLATSSRSGPGDYCGDACARWSEERATSPADLERGRRARDLETAGPQPPTEPPAAVAFRVVDSVCSRHGKHRGERCPACAASRARSEGSK